MLNKINVCSDCFDELNPKFIYFSIYGVKALAIYEYDEQMSTLIYQYKGCGDYELKDIFINQLLEELIIKYKGYKIVSIPSHIEHIKKRGFDHVKEMFSSLRLEFIDCLFKKEKYKQSDYKIEERSEAKNLIGIKNGEALKNKKILIVDDICTTGSTLRSAIKLVSLYEPKDIKILVVAKRVFTNEEVKTLGKSYQIT